MKKMNIWKKVLLVIFLLLAAGVISILAVKMNIKKEREKKASAPGNAEEYSLEHVEQKKDSPLRGKRILFLGSSVTYGEAANGTSFADYLGKIDGVYVTKEAVSATTLADEFSGYAYLASGNGDSYVKRLKKVGKTEEFDAVVVQLSTNDAAMEKPLGEISQSANLEDFDVKTVTGAIEYIIKYAEETWGCPVIFYTGTYFESETYSAMVARLAEIQEKWKIGMIDLYDDTEMNDIDEETYNLYMYDEIHPTKAGYLKWWLPAIQKYLYDYLK